ncbi:hypothetical protein GCM10009819_00260 [Agromyces tropicus]|uniref:Uncharacterized protein n=1 Tax=Agromyces tropicus TaxID=555371 RepID=A0ABN2TVF4_9MICO
MSSANESGKARQRGRPRAIRLIKIVAVWKARPDPRRLAKVLRGLAPYRDAPSPLGTGSQEMPKQSPTVEEVTCHDEP